MPVTRRQIAEEVSLLLGEYYGTPGHGDPIYLSRLVISATDKVAEDTFCYWATYTGDLDGTPEAPKSRFCPPLLFEIVHVVVTLESGKKRKMEQVTQRGMAQMRARYLTDPEVGEPRFWMPDGSGVALYPFVGYTRAGAITYSGWGVPGEEWVAGQPPSDSDPFPLPPYAKDAVVFQAGLMRCIQFPSPENLARFGMLKDEYQAAKGRLEREIARQHDLGQRPAVAGGGEYWL